MVANLVVFNKLNVSAWENELSVIPSQITSLEDKKGAIETKIQPTLTALNIAKSQLKTQEEMIESTKLQLSQLELSQNIDYSNHVQVSNNQHRDKSLNHVQVSTNRYPDQSKAETFSYHVNNLTRTHEITRLRSTLSEMESLRSKIESQITELRNSIAPDQTNTYQLNTEIISLHGKEIRLKRQCAAAKIFFNRLQHDPKGLFESITGPLLKNLAKYKRSTEHHSHTVRICLLQFEEKVKFLHEGGVTKKSEQEVFARLCGLLISTHNHLVSQQAEAKFLSLFADAILSTHIDQDGDLPDEFALGQSCSTLYRDLQTQHAKDLGDMSIDQLLESEQAQYQKTLGDLKTLFDQIRLEYRLCDDFDKKGNDVIALIEAKKRALFAQDPKDSNGTLNYYTKILTQTYQLALDPSNRQLQKAYKVLANDFAGTPSTHRKLGGAMLAFLGVVVVVASVLLIPTTLTPMIYIGVVSGVGLFAAGAALYKSGMRDKDSKVITDYANAAASLKERRSQPSFFEKPVKHAVSNDMANDKPGPVPISATA